MCTYPEQETIVSRTDDDYVTLVWPHGNPPRFWQYRVNKRIRVRGEIVETELVGRGTAPTSGEAETAAKTVYDLAKIPCYAVD